MLVLLVFYVFFDGYCWSNVNSVCSDVRDACIMDDIPLSKCTWGGYNNGVIYHVIVVKSGRLSWPEIIKNQWLCNVPTDTVHKTARFLTDNLNSRDSILKVIEFLHEHLNYDISKQHQQLCEVFAQSRDDEFIELLSKNNGETIGKNFKPILCLIDEANSQREMAKLLKTKYQYQRPKMHLLFMYHYY